MTTLLKDPADLRPHPLKKQMPQPPDWRKGSDFFNDLADDIRNNGVKQPLLISADGLILDGELRWQAARQAQLTEVPCIIEQGPAANVILMALLRRKHLTKGGRAYLAFPLFEAALKESKDRRIEYLKKGTAPGATYQQADTAETIAAQLGISRRLFFHAKEVHEIFAKDQEFKALMEPNILSDDPEDCMGLGRVIAGYGGRHATAGKTKGSHDQLTLFTEVMEDQFIRIKYWQSMGEEERRKLWKEVDRMTHEVEPEQIEGLIEFHQAMARRLLKSLKELKAAA